MLTVVLAVLWPFIVWYALDNVYRVAEHHELPGGGLSVTLRPFWGLGHRRTVRYRDVKYLASCRWADTGEGLNIFAYGAARKCAVKVRNKLELERWS